MLTANRDIMTSARDKLRGKWGIAVGVSFIYLVITFVLSPIPVLGWIASILIAGPLFLGVTIFFLALARGQEVKTSQLFEGFSYFTDALLTYLLMCLFILLWLLLLIIPGIMAAYSYSMTFYIMADNKEINGLDAIKKSKAMMYGNRWKLFCLGCRFIGWMLLCILTLGIGFLWLMPYGSTSMAKFYDDVRTAQETKQEAAPQPIQSKANV
jgi:uncharacterized membrane protein